MIELEIVGIFSYNLYIVVLKDVINDFDYFD